MAAVTAVFAALVWHRRWISDDGLIYVRTVHQILAGNGPVFNAFERTEANTSSLWPWLVAAVAALTGGAPAPLTVALGGGLSVAGVWLAMDGTRRLLRARGATGAVVPAGVLIVLGVGPFWDFATSGLETGLCTLWLAAIWRRLIGLRDELPDGPPAGSGAGRAARRLYGAAFVFGLGPLVRPDLAVPAAVFLIAGWLIIRRGARRPGWRRTAGLAAAAGALPVGYEIFRAGYYGALVPLPALAKSAGGSQWRRGLSYLADFVAPYALWLPIAILAIVLIVAVRRGALAGPHRRADRIIVAAPVVSGALLAGFVIRVGGDFMHARMLLPSAFLAVLPALVVPWRRWTAPAVVALAGWALAIGIWRDDNLDHSRYPQRIEDERVGYLRYTRQAHPIDAAAYLDGDLDTAGRVFLAAHTGRPQILSESGVAMPIGPGVAAPVAVIVGRLGTGGAMTPLDGIVGDTLGLANPIGARITPTSRSMAGHEKLLPFDWLIGDFGAVDFDYGAMFPGMSVPAARAAHHAMACGRLAELLASVREPMSPGRFWRNLTGAFGRTTLVIPSSPFWAERVFCGATGDPDLALGVTVSASSAYEESGWLTTSLVDGIRTSTPAHPGFSSALGRTQPHEEWIALTLPWPATISKVVLHPTYDPGFPIDFTVQAWRDGGWVDVVTQVGYARPAMVPQVFALRAPVTTQRIRLDATRLREVGGYGYLLQLAEIELLP
ncbi:MAG TPA: discoidin domain-containing protein [Kofleriaceae bacterium]|nr:discoidin domain-containing protein [Kofleriaceae bacterium]